MGSSVRALVFLVLLLISQLLSADTEQRFYRYISDTGVMVISSQIPARYVLKGYDIISRSGTLIKRVPPELSDKDKAKLEDQRIEQARLKAWDDDLLRLYSSPYDIESAKQRKLQQILSDLRIIARNIEKINEDINRYQVLAAADERAERSVSKTILDNIEELKKDRKLEENRRLQKQNEQQEIIEKFDRDIARFKIIRPNSYTH